MGVTMATNFGTKIAINAYKCISTRRTLPWQPNFGLNRLKHHKNGHNFSCMRHIHAVWFWDRVCAVGEFTYDTHVHQRQRGITMTTNFGTKIAINAYKCVSKRGNENAITYSGSSHDQPIQRRHFWLQGSKARCRGNQILANIGKNITKIATTSVACNISMQSLVLRWGLCYQPWKLGQVDLLVDQ